MDRWEGIGGQPPIAAATPSGRRPRIDPAPTALGSDSSHRRALRLDPAARPAPRPPAVLRPHRLPQQPGRACSPTWSARPQRVRGKLDGRRRGVGGRARRARVAARVDGDAGGRPRACSSAAARRHAHRARCGRRTARDAIAIRRRATSTSTRTPRRAGDGGRSASTPATCACCARTATHRLRRGRRRGDRARPRSGPRAVRASSPRPGRRARARSTRWPSSPTGRARGLWLHVDGAYGAPAADARRRELLPASSAPIRSCSIRTSGSSSPTRAAACSCATRRCSSGRSRSRVPTCATKAGGEVEFRDRGLQLTRGSRALKLWLSLRVFGSTRSGKRSRAGSRSPNSPSASTRAHGWEVVSPARLAIVCFRRAGADDERPTRWCARRSPTATPRPARRARGAPSRGCARSTRARQSRTSRARSSGSNALADPLLRRGTNMQLVMFQIASATWTSAGGEGGPAHRRPSLLQEPLFQPILAGLVRTEREVGRGSLFGGSVRDADRLGSTIVNRSLAVCARSPDRGLTWASRWSGHTEHRETPVSWRVYAR